MSCSSASASMPFVSASLARGLSSEPRPSVSRGSTSRSRKRRPSSMRNGFANRRARLRSPFFMVVLLSSSPRTSRKDGVDGVATNRVALGVARLLRLPAPAERAIQLHEGDELAQLGTGERVFRGKELLLRLQHLVVGREAS